MTNFSFNSGSSCFDSNERVHLGNVYRYILSWELFDSKKDEPAADYLGGDTATGSGAGSPTDAGGTLVADPTRRESITGFFEEQGHYEL